MHAVIATGGKQYRVQEGDVLRIEKLEIAAGETVEFDQVLLVSDGENVRVGSPHVSGGKVSAEVQQHGRGDKIEIIKFKRRKDYHRTQGHRQSFTEIKITGIAAGAE